jgi:hypothetical protein
MLRGDDEIKDVVQAGYRITVQETVLVLCDSYDGPSEEV